jgi:transcriptional regulator with XRE-family HTH domain
MENAQRPTMRSRKLGQRLRAIREDRGLTLQKAARLLNRTPSSLSKLETGKRGIRRPALEYILDHYELTDPAERQALYDLAKDSGKKGWWLRYEGKVSASMLDYISIEAEATSSRTFQLHLIPGLLQTEDYARAVIDSTISLGDPHDVEGLTELRMRRQRILDRKIPLQLWAILSEAVLYQQFGGVDVMRRQLQHLLDAATLPNVTLQVLPFAAGAHPGHNGSFTSLVTGDLSVVLVENQTTGLYLEELVDILYHDMIFDHLRAASLAPSDSIAMIERLWSTL